MLPTILNFVKQPYSPGANTYAVYVATARCPDHGTTTQDGWCNVLVGGNPHNLRPIGWVDVDWDDQWYVAPNPLNKKEFT